MTKKTLIFAGNCQAENLSDLFRQTPAIRDEWSVSWFNPGATGETMARQIEALRVCNVLVKQDIKGVRENEALGRLSSDAREIRMPFYYYGALWPFDAWQNEPDQAAAPDLPNNEKFAFRDSLLSRLRKEVPDHEERFRRYRDLDVPGVKDIEKYAAFEERRLRLMDRLTGFTLGNYIIENVRSQRLFHTVTHATLDLLKLQCEDVFRMLGIGLTAAAIPQRRDAFTYFQVPLHPAVIDKLGIAWATPDSAYNFWNREQLTWEAYVRKYIAIYG